MSEAVLPYCRIYCRTARMSEATEIGSWSKGHKGETAVCTYIDYWLVPVASGIVFIDLCLTPEFLVWDNFFLQCSGGKWRRVVFRITYGGEAAVQTSFSGGEMGVNQSPWRWLRLLWRGRAAADPSRDSVVDYCPLREDIGCGHSS